MDFFAKSLYFSAAPDGKTGQKEGKTMGERMIIRKGDRVRDAKWRAFTGTVVRTATCNGRRVVYVQWDDLAVEDELLETSVEALGTRVEGEIPPVFLTVALGVKAVGR
jgi:hypothetical protein